MKDKILQEDLEKFCVERYEWMDVLDGKTILITGVSGLIGSQIAKAILSYNIKFNTNIHIIGMARNKIKTEKVFQDFKNGNIEFIYGDVTEYSDYSCNLDYIIHCANTTSSKEYVEKPVETIKTIVNGTEKLLELAKNQKDCTFLYLSSMEVYGSVTEQEGLISENDSGYINPVSIRSSYSEGKRMAECLCASYAKEYNVNTKIARLAQVFGADVSLEDNRIFAQLAKCVINKAYFVMHTLGKSYGNYCYTIDAVKALLMLLTKGETGEAYNVVNEDTCISIGKMAEMVASEVGNFNIVYDIPESAFKYGYAPDTKMHLSAKKINELGWKASVGLKEMYIRMIESMKCRM